MIQILSSQKLRFYEQSVKITTPFYFPKLFFVAQKDVGSIYFSHSTGTGLLPWNSLLVLIMSFLVDASPQFVYFITELSLRVSIANKLNPFFQGLTYYSI